MSSPSNYKGSASAVTKAWENQLAEGGYEPPSPSIWLKIRIKYLTRTWRSILKHTRLKLSDQVKVLEFGCGGGTQLIPLFANGWTCVGVDCSMAVLSRAKEYMNLVIENELLKNKKGRIRFINGDFINFKSAMKFDLAFQFGVMEHFFSAEERLTYMKKMFETVKPGGYVVNFVPNGEHPYRHEQKAGCLGGYNIPEIDYSVSSLKKEMLLGGASSVKIIPHDLMGYIKLKETDGIKRATALITYLTLQTPIFQRLPMAVLRKQAFWLIGIGQK